MTEGSAGRPGLPGDRPRPSGPELPKTSHQEPLPRLEAQGASGASRTGSWSASVVLAGYGDDLVGLERSIYSALLQTLGDVQVVLVGDAGMVRRAEQVDLEGRLVVVETGGSEDPGVDRERGLRAASGHLVAFLEPGDLWFEDHLRRAAACLGAEPRAGLVLGAVAFAGSDAERCVREPDLASVTSVGRVAPPVRTLRELLPLWTLSGAVFRRCVLAEHGTGGRALLGRGALAGDDGAAWSTLTAAWPLCLDPDPPGWWSSIKALERCARELVERHRSRLQASAWGPEGPADPDRLEERLEQGAMAAALSGGLIAEPSAARLLVLAARLARDLLMELDATAPLSRQLAPASSHLDERAPRLSAVLDLFYVAELDPAAVARLLGSTEAEVRQDLRRALDLMGGDR